MSTEIPASASAPSPDEARRLLAEARATGRLTTAAAGWPAVAVMLSLGTAVSMGTLAMGLTAGANYLVALVGLLAWVLVVIVFQLAVMRSTAAGASRRWIGFIVALFVVYVPAMIVVAGSQGEAVVATCLLAGALMAITVGFAAVEAREARR